MNQTKQKKSYSFNIVDALIIAVAVCVIAAGVYFVFFRRGSGDDTVRLEYVLEIAIQKKEFDGDVKIGDTVINTVAKDKIGTVVAVKYENALGTTTDHNSGQMAVVEYPDDVYSKMTMTVRTDAKRESGVFYIKTLQISVGKTVYFRTPGYIGTARCTGIRVLDTKTTLG